MHLIESLALEGNRFLPVTTCQESWQELSGISHFNLWTFPTIHRFTLRAWQNEAYGISIEGLQYSPCCPMSYTPFIKPRGLPYKSDLGDRRQFCEEPLKVRIALCGCGSNSFSHLRGSTNSKTKPVPILFFFRLNTLKGTRITLSVVMLDLNTLKGATIPRVVKLCYLPSTPRINRLICISWERTLLRDETWASVSHYQSFLHPTDYPPPPVGTPLYRYVRRQRVWLFSRFGLKTGIPDFEHFCLKWGMFCLLVWKRV